MSHDQWIRLTVIGSEYEEEHNPVTDEYRHRQRSLREMFYKRRTFEEQVYDMENDNRPWTPGPAPKPTWSKS